MADSAFTTILARHREHLVSKVADAPAHWTAELEADGSWPDIAYDDRSNSGWQPFQHWARIRDLALARQRGEAPAETEQTIRSALAWWLRELPTSPNWWHNDIAVPQAAVDLLILAPDLVVGDAREGCLRLARAALSKTQTGQNLMWRCQAGILLACLTEDADLLAELAARVAGEIRVTEDEGIQADGSFHQHGAQFYSGGYGLAFTQDAVHLARLLSGTPWAIGEEKLDILRHYLLEGQRWFWMRGRFALSAQGREIARKVGPVPRGRFLLLQAARSLAEMGGTEEVRRALEEMADRLEHDPGPAPLVSGFKVFGRSDVAVDHRAAFSASLKWVSERTQPTEAGNGENLLGYHLCHGLLLWMRHGGEYDAIFPVWDWQRLPGVTAARVAELPVRGWRSNPSPITVAGGLSDGREGVVAMAFEDHPPYGRLRARKAWFFTEEGTVALGNAIKGEGALPVWTSVEQSHARGPVWVGGRAGPLEGRQSLRTRWVYHDGRVYLFPEAPLVTVGIAPQTGSWHRVNARYGGEEISAPVFSIWIDHGVAPSDASYVYAILPAEGPEDAAIRAEAFPWKVVANNASAQVLQHGESGREFVVSYQAGESGLVDSPCLVMVDGQGGRTVQPLGGR